MSTLEVSYCGGGHSRILMKETRFDGVPIRTAWVDMENDPLDENDRAFLKELIFSESLMEWVPRKEGQEGTRCP